MAIFSNQATLTYNGNTTNSNIAYGEILETLAVTKTAVQDNYTPGEQVTYVVSLRNTGTTALTGLTLSDDLGATNFNTTTVYPLTYVPDSIRVLVNGVLQAAPAVTAGPPLGITGISVPAGGNVVILYQAEVNEFADPAAGGTITNNVSITGGGLTTPATAQAVLTGSAEPELTINKSISPAQVADNDRVTYTFVIQNSGNSPAAVTDNVSVTDTFDPILTNLTVTLDGTPLTLGTQYQYNQATGLFTTVPGQITVPAATYTQDPTTGAYTLAPGIVTLTVTGTI